MLVGVGVDVGTGVLVAVGAGVLVGVGVGITVAVGSVVGATACVGFNACVGVGMVFFSPAQPASNKTAPTNSKALYLNFIFLIAFLRIFPGYYIIQSKKRIGVPIRFS